MSEPTKKDGDKLVRAWVTWLHHFRYTELYKVNEKAFIEANKN